MSSSRHTSDKGISRLGHCFAFVCNDSSLVATAIVPFQQALTFKRGAPKGWGLGLYQDDQALIRRHPTGTDDDPGIFQECSKLRSNIIVGQLREPQSHVSSPSNTQPFRYRQWMFVFSSDLDQQLHEIGSPIVMALRETLIKSCPPFIARMVNGDSLGELLFLRFITELKEMGLIESPETTSRMAIDALSKTLAALRTACQNAALPSQILSFAYSCIVSDGRFIIANHSQARLRILRYSTYHDVRRTMDNKPVHYPHLKAALLMSGDTGDAEQPGWESIEEHSFITIDPHLNIGYGS